MVYYTTTSSYSTDDFDVANAINEIGTVNAIAIAPTVDMNNVKVETGVLLTCNLSEDSNISVTTGSYLFFSKDNQVNMSSILGYYGEANFINDSNIKAELFAASCEISESSK